MIIKPMLLKETTDKELLKAKDKLFQIKFNGVRAIVHVKDYKIVGIRSRSNNPTLHYFPELRATKLNIEEGILDGEICVFKQDKSIFYGGIDKRRSAPAERILANYPVSLVVFDALKVNGEVIVNKPYKDRYDLIKDISSDTGVVRVATNNSDGELLWELIEEKDLEGVVIKNPLATYQLDTRSTEYLKLKNYKQAVVTVSQIEPNPKGIKIYGQATIKDEVIDVECQLAGEFNVKEGDVRTIKYLEVSNGRLIQPTRL